MPRHITRSHGKQSL